MTKVPDNDYLIKNAIYCWLHQFGHDHPWSIAYKELASRDKYITPPTPRPAKRRRTRTTTT